MSFFSWFRTSPTVPLLNSQALREIYTPYPSKPDIFRYLLNDQTSVNDVAARITRFLADNPFLTATFPTIPPEALQREISQKKYLVIHGQAICLANESESPLDAEDRFKDSLTGSLLIEPVKCTRGHYFERARAVTWASSRGNVCPMGSHPLGPLEIDTTCLSDLNSYKTVEQETQRFNEIDAAEQANPILYEKKQIEKLDEIIARAKIQSLSMPSFMSILLPSFPVPLRHLPSFSDVANILLFPIQEALTQYKILNLEPNFPYTKKEIDLAYLRQIPRISPERATALGLQAKLAHVKKLLDSAKSAIYQEHHWT